LAGVKFVTFVKFVKNPTVFKNYPIAFNDKPSI